MFLPRLPGCGLANDLRTEFWSARCRHISAEFCLLEWQVIRSARRIRKYALASPSRFATVSPLYPLALIVMPLTFGLAKLSDLSAKLQRDAVALNEEVTSDRLFNFVVTGYSMIDWVKNDPTVPASAKMAIDVFRNEKWVRVCGDLATAAKHFSLKRRKPITDSVTTERGWGDGRFSKGGWGVGEESIEVTLNDGTTFSCLELAEGVIDSWESFFKCHGI